MQVIGEANDCSRPPAPNIGFQLTTCVKTIEELVADSASPLYVAVIGCEPAASFGLVRAADPALSATLPMLVVPSLKTTVPRGNVGTGRPDLRRKRHGLAVVGWVEA